MQNVSGSAQSVEQQDISTANTVSYIWKRMLVEHSQQTGFPLTTDFPAFTSLSVFAEVVSHFEKLFDFLIGVEKNAPSATLAILPYSGVVYMLLSQWDEEDQWMIRRIHTLCVFMTRTSGERPDLHETAIQQFVELDQFGHVTDGYALHEILNRIVASDNLTREKLYSSIEFGHGPGSTSEGHRDRVKKDQHVGVPRSSLHFFNKVLTKPLLDIVPDEGSNIVTVPKSYKTRRTIATEPIGLQYMQQGLKNAIYKEVLNNRSTFFGRHCYLQSTDKQDEAVRLSSIDNSQATIDLSAASDRVSLSLVESVFPNTIFEDVVHLRTSFVYIEGGTLSLNKYATMGNALTFPVETILFALICCEAIERCGKDFYKSNFCVYGDDIIIDTDVAPMLLFLLEDYGFYINRKKSFFGEEYFRESCGYFYYRGMDIRPLRISRKFRGLSDDYKYYDQIKDLLISLRLYDFPDTSYRIETIMYNKSDVFYGEEYSRPSKTKDGKTTFRWPIFVQNRGWENKKLGSHLAEKLGVRIKKSIQTYPGSVGYLSDHSAYSKWLYETRDRSPRVEFDDIMLNKVERIKVHRTLLHKEMIEQPVTIDTRPVGRSGFQLRRLPKR